MFGKHPKIVWYFKGRKVTIYTLELVFIEYVIQIIKSIHSYNNKWFNWISVFKIIYFYNKFPFYVKYTFSIH